MERTTEFMFHVYYFKPYNDSMFISLSTPVASEAIANARILHDKGVRIALYEEQYDYE